MSDAVAIQPRQWRKHVAVGASPRFGGYIHPEAPTGAKEFSKSRGCRPYRGYGIVLFPFRGLTPTATCYRPAGAKLRDGFVPRMLTKILADRDREAAQLDAFLKELGYE